MSQTLTNCVIKWQQACRQGSAHEPPPQPGPGIGLSPITTERHSRGRYARYPSELRSGQLLSPNRQYEHSSLRHTSPQHKYKFACSKDTCVYRVGQHYPDPRTRSVVHHTKNPGATFAPSAIVAASYHRPWGRHRTIGHGADIAPSAMGQHRTMGRVATSHHRPIFQPSPWAVTTARTRHRPIAHNHRAA